MNGTRAQGASATLPAFRPVLSPAESLKQSLGSLQKALGRILKVTGRQRDTFFLAGDGITALLATVLLCSLPAAATTISASHALIAGAVAAALVVLANLMFGNYRLAWVTFSLADLRRLFGATFLVTLVLSLLAAARLPMLHPLPNPLLWGMTLFLFLSTFRGSKRLLIEPLFTSAAGKRTLLVMSSRHAYFLPNILRRLTDFPHTIIGIVDPDPNQVGNYEQGVEVLGTTGDVEAIVEKYRVEAVIVMLESDPGFNLGDFYSRLHRLKRLDVKTMPSLIDILENRQNGSALEKLCIHELTGLPPASIDLNRIHQQFTGRRIMVTGAGGSIGSELCRQLARLSPSRLIMFERDDSNLFYIDRELQATHPALDKLPVLGDITHVEDLEKVFAEHRPEVIFHAAAYKHVPILEFHPDDAVRVNVFGAHLVTNMAVRYGAECLVYVSTDKAVNPTSAMGATKRLGEMLVTSMNGLADIRTIAVRFGNVLDSRGSVTTLFREAIAGRKPITVTHKEMRRYFMLTSEAVMLMLQAAAQGKGGEVFVLDMGKPVRIWDLALRMVELAGLTPDTDLPMLVTGMRPGEKLFEELLTAEEGTVATRNERIRQARISRNYCYPDLLQGLRALEQTLGRGDRSAIKQALTRLVPNYRPDSCDGLRPSCNLGTKWSRNEGSEKATQRQSDRAKNPALDRLAVSLSAD